MGVKVFEQTYPGQNSAYIKPTKEVNPREWERKQRLKEYRIASRREKRNRKSDEKKQRKLNATILRRMTRNPAKYNKNAGRNRLRAIELERRKIRTAAVFMAQRLAAVHDPSGQMFNVKPVTTLEDGRVISLEALERRKETDARKLLGKSGETVQIGESAERKEEAASNAALAEYGGSGAANLLDPERMKLIIESEMPSQGRQPMSKTQQKKNEKFAPRSPPLRPIIPEGIDIPSDEEENWLELWDMNDEELERRVLRAKKRAVKARKDFRVKQQSGKAERRAARDEKRRVYRDLKQGWKVIREEERRRRKFLLSMEDEERKKLAVQVTTMEREQAMECAASFGFTLENVEGVKEIQPKALGMKGMEVDFDKLEVDGEAQSGLKVAQEKPREKGRKNRVDLGAIADESLLKPVSGWNPISEDAGLGDQSFVEFGDGIGQDYEAPNYNHKLRRKLRRAIESASLKKELLVRAKAIEHCEENGIDVPAILRTAGKPQNVKGQRTMPNGTLETGKQERVRQRVELSEFNLNAKVLRRQAKEMAVEAGIRVYLELTGRIPRREGAEEEFAMKAEPRSEAGMGGEAAMSMADLLDSWPAPEDEYVEVESGLFAEGGVKIGSSVDEEVSEDSAAKQLQTEINQEVGFGKGELSKDSEESEDSDVDMTDGS